MAPSITGGVPALATFNPVTGAMWLDYADGRTVTLPGVVRTANQAGAALQGIGAVRFSDWGLVAPKAPMRQARIEVSA